MQLLSPVIFALAMQLLATIKFQNRLYSSVLCETINIATQNFVIYNTSVLERAFTCVCVCETWTVDLEEDLGLGHLQADCRHIWNKHGGGNEDWRKLSVSPSAVLCRC